MSETFLNKYEVQSDKHKYTLPQDYDLNFNATRNIHTLRGRNVELRPLIPSCHAQILHEHFSDIDRVVAIGGTQFDVLSSVFGDLESARASDGELMFAVFVDPELFNPLPLNAPRPFHDPTASPETAHWIFAGQVGVYGARLNRMSCGMGIGIIHQLTRHGVGSEAACVLLDWAFRLPSENDGLGMRRVFWQAHMWNEDSKRLATSLGFQYEGVSRCDRTVPLAGNFQNVKEPTRKGDRLWPLVSCDMWIASATFVDWESGGLKERVQSRIYRRADAH